MNISVVWILYTHSAPGREVVASLHSGHPKRATVADTGLVEVVFEG